MYVSPTGCGEVTINGNPVISGVQYSFTNDSFLSVIATPAIGYAFSGWSGNVVSDSYAVKVITSYDKIITANFIEFVPVETVPVYYPHIACNGGWETEICLINSSLDDTLSGIFHAYDDQGALLSSSARITLAAHGRIQLYVNRDFDKAAEIGYIIFAAETNSVKDIVGYTKFYVNERYRAAVPVVTTVNQEDIFVTHIASDDDWWTGISLVNTTTESKTLAFEFDNGEIRTITMAANEHRVFIMETLLERGTTEVHSAVIRNASGIIGLEMFSRDDLLSGILLDDQIFSEIYYPHIAIDNGWWTGVVVYNTTPAVANLSITSYSATGVSLGMIDVNIDGHSRYVGSVAGLGFPATTAWFKVDSDQPISGFELFGAENGSQMAAYSVGGTGGDKGVFPKLDSDGFAGLVMANVAAQEATIVMRAYKDDGMVVGTETITLAGYAKVVALAQDLFNDDISLATHIVYYANREIVAFQLNGSDDGMLLDSLPALR